MSLIPLEPCPFLDVRPPWFLFEPAHHWTEVLPNSKIFSCMIMYKRKHATQQSSKYYHPKHYHQTSSSKHCHQDIIKIRFHSWTRILPIAGRQCNPSELLISKNIILKIIIYHLKKSKDVLLLNKSNSSKY